MWTETEFLILEDSNMKTESKVLGGVRELSYDAKYAKPNGQTVQEIKADASKPDKHVPKPDRWFLLRFLGISQS